MLLNRYDAKGHKWLSLISCNVQNTCHLIHTILLQDFLTLDLCEYLSPLFMCHFALPSFSIVFAATSHLRLFHIITTSQLTELPVGYLDASLTLMLFFALSQNISTSIKYQNHLFILNSSIPSSEFLYSVLVKRIPVTISPKYKPIFLVF